MVLYLRYGTETPSTSEKPRPLLTCLKVAEVMKVPVTFVISALNKYFYAGKVAEKKRLSLQPPKLNAKPSTGS